MGLDTYLHGHGCIMQTSGLGTTALLVLPRSRVLEPIFSFVDVVCTGFGTRSFSYQRYMHRFCWVSAAEDVFTSKRSLLHVPFIDLGCPCL